MKQYSADYTCLNILRTLIITAAVLLSSAAYFFLSFIPIIMWSVIALFLSVSFFASAIYLPLYFSKTKYYVSSGRIIKKSGAFFETKQVMSFKAIQYSTVMSAPFSKKTGFNFAILNAFGGRMIIAFMRFKDLDEIMMEISLTKSDS